MKAIKITSTSKISVVNLEDLESMTKHIEGFLANERPKNLYGEKFKTVPEQNKLCMIYNERDYLSNRVSYNMVATELFVTKQIYFPVLSNVLFVNKGDSEYHHNNYISLSDEQIQVLFSVFKNEYPFLEEEYENTTEGGLSNV